MDLSAASKVGGGLHSLNLPAGIPQHLFRAKPVGVLRIVVALLCLSGLLSLIPLPALGQSNELTDWRNALTRTRMLAENDAPAAYARLDELALQLPATATPADQVRLLNVRSRIEVYLAKTEISQAHAELARNLADRHGDRVGQVEADLNLSLCSVNLGRIDLLVQSTSRLLGTLEGLERPDLLGEAMLRTSMMYRRLGQMEESVAMALHAMEVAERQKDPMALAFAHQGLAVAYDQSFRYRDAFHHYQQMKLQARAAGSSQLEAYAELGMGGSSTLLGDAASGEQMARQAIATFRRIGHPYAINFGQFHLAQSLRNQSRLQEALPLLDEVLDRYSRHPSQIGSWYTLNARSDTYRALKRISEAKSDAERAYQVAQRVGLSLYMSESAQRLATLAADSGDFQKAFELSTEARRMTENASREHVSARMSELSRRFQEESRQREIVELSRRNQEQTEELRRRQLAQRWLGSLLAVVLVMVGALAVVHARLRRSRSELSSKSTILQSILDSMGDAVAVADPRGQLVLVNPLARTFGIDAAPPYGPGPGLGARFLLADRATPCPPESLPMALASRGESCDGTELYLESGPQSAGRWLSVTTRPLHSAAGTAVGGVAVFTEITQLKRAEQALREMSARRETAREEERRYIARELHDELGQTLSALRFEVAVLRVRHAADNLELSESLASMLVLVDRVIRVQRDLVYSLRPAVLDMGIGPALEWLTADFSGRTGMECSLHLSEAEPALDAEQSTMVFRIVQESLTNVGRHARASRVKVALELEEDCCHLSVQDNGVGFDMARSANSHSLGLLGLHERARMLGGQLVVQTSPNQGVTIALSFPSSAALEAP